MLHASLAFEAENVADALSREDVIKELMRIRGVGQATAEKLFAAGVRKIEDIQSLPGVSAAIKLCAKYVDELEQPITRGEAGKIIRKLQKSHDATPAGSYRRGKRLLHDIDIVIVADEAAEEIAENMSGLGILSAGKERATLLLPIRAEPGVAMLDLYVTSADRKGAMMLYATGPGTWNIVLRIHARKRGFKLSQHGLFKLRSDGKDKLIAAKTEEEIFAALDLPYIEPHDRGSDEVMKRLFGRKD